MEEKSSKVPDIKRPSFLLLMACRVILLFFPITMMIYALIFAISGIGNFSTLLVSMLLADIIINLYNSLHKEEILYIQSLNNKEDNKKIQ